MADLLAGAALDLLGRFVAIATAILLLLALGPWPYGYYQLLRVVVFAAGVYLGIRTKGQGSIAVGCFLAAAIFNPFLPAHLPRELWSILNIAGAVLFGWIAWRGRRPH